LAFAVEKLIIDIETGMDEAVIECMTRKHAVGESQT